MDILLIVFAGILLIIGFLGCIVPMLPGTPISYLGIIVLNFSSKAEFSTQFLIRWAIIVIAVQGLDYLIPIWGTKAFGGSKLGVWGSMIGLLIGFLLGPWGIIFGAIIGAFIGEILSGKASKQAIRAAFGSFLGFLIGSISQLVVAGYLLYYYFDALI